MHRLEPLKAPLPWQVLGEAIVCLGALVLTSKALRHLQKELVIPFDLQKERRELESEIFGFLFIWEYFDLHLIYIP